MKKKPIVETAELFVGAYLGGIRAKAGIPLEQAAKDTRIRVQRLREIESDDFSGFVHPTYVRLFLLDYAHYLGVPLEEIQPMLPDRIGMVIGGFEYLNVLGTKDNRKPRIETSHPRNHLLIFLVVLAAATIALVLGFSAYLLWRNVEAVALSAPISKEVPEQAAPAPTPAEKLIDPPASAPEVDSEMQAEGAVIDLSTPAVKPDPSAAAKPWPDVELSPFGSASPMPSPSPSPTPSRRRPR